MLAIDLNAGGAALLISLLAAHDQLLLYIPGRIVHHAAATYRGDGKTDAKDARIIADQARMRTDLQPVRRADQIATDLRLMTSRRTDVICDRVRAINRLRETLLAYFPPLERAFDYPKSKAALTLLSRYQTPDSLRRIGAARLETWLKTRGCRNSATIAQAAIEAAQAQHITLPPQNVGAQPVTRLAAEITAIDAELADIDEQIAARFAQHDSAEILLSLPGFGPVLAATFLAQIGGNLEGFDTVDRLACVAGLARPHATPGASAATRTGPAASTAGCCERAIWRRCPALRTARHPGRSTTENAPRADHTNKRSSPWPDAASTSSGPCCATTPTSTNPIAPTRQ